MIRITSSEAKQLRKMGVKDGMNGISHTYAHHRSHYLCESQYNMVKLKKIRQE